MPSSRGPAAGAVDQEAEPGVSKHLVLDAYAKLPLSFVANAGQLDGAGALLRAGRRVRLLCHASPWLPRA